MAAEVQKNDQGNDRLSFVRSNPFLRIEEKQNLGQATTRPRRDSKTND